MDLYNGFNGLRHRINWTYFTVLDGLAHPLYSISHVYLTRVVSFTNPLSRDYNPFFILSMASKVASLEPKEVNLKYPSPCGPNPHPGVPTI